MVADAEPDLKEDTGQKEVENQPVSERRET